MSTSDDARAEERWFRGIDDEEDMSMADALEADAAKLEAMGLDAGPTFPNGKHTEDAGDDLPWESTTIVGCSGGCGRTVTITLAGNTRIHSAAWTCADCHASTREPVE